VNGAEDDGRNSGESTRRYCFTNHKPVTDSRRTGVSNEGMSMTDKCIRCGEMSTKRKLKSLLP
jgi:hypothetical protein